MTRRTDATQTPPSVSQSPNLDSDIEQGINTSGGFALEGESEREYGDSQTEATTPRAATERATRDSEPARWPAYSPTPRSSGNRARRSCPTTRHEAQRSVSVGTRRGKAE